MTRLSSFRETVEAVAACADDHGVWERYCWIYVQGSAPLMESHFYLMSRLDEDEGEDEPSCAAELDLSSFLEGATFADVLSVQKRQRADSSLEDYAVALEHYSEQDAFLEVSGGEDEQSGQPGLARDLYAEYDSNLVECAPEQIGAAARATAAVLGIDIASALHGCRQLPLCLGERINDHQRLQIEERFAALSIALQRVTHRSFPWQPDRQSAAMILSDLN